MVTGTTLALLSLIVLVTRNASCSGKKRVAVCSFNAKNINQIERSKSMIEVTGEIGKSPRWVGQGGGIYLDNQSGRYYHRPTIEGKRTYRLLDVRTLTQARSLKAQQDTAQTMHANGLGKDPYGMEALNIGDLFVKYREAGCPTKRKIRTGAQLDQEISRLNFLEPFWKLRKCNQVKPKDCFAYVAERKKTVRKGFHGGRAFDMELATLCGVFNWAFIRGVIEVNPLTVRPKFRGEDGAKIRHCRDAMPNTAAELHSLAGALFEDPRSEVLGWQLLIEAMTGCRTSEVLRLRWDAANRSQSGFIEGSHLWLQRSKNGVNPFCEIHPALEETLQALKCWRAWRKFSANPWFLPSTRNPGQAVTDKSLTQALSRVAPLVLGRKVISHGLRAYYVTVRRSMGIADVQIAGEIGDVSGAALIVSTYGAMPANWRGGDGLGWAVEKPAWQALKMPQNLLPMAM